MVVAAGEAIPQLGPNVPPVLEVQIWRPDVNTAGNGGAPDRCHSAEPSSSFSSKLNSRERGTWRNRLSASGSSPRWSSSVARRRPHLLDGVRVGARRSREDAKHVGRHTWVEGVEQHDVQLVHCA